MSLAFPINQLTVSRLRIHFVGCFAAILFLQLGCQGVAKPGLPRKESVQREQLIVHSDFHLPQRHRLLDELVARRGDIGAALGVPTSDEEIDVYLFDDSKSYRSYMQERFQNFPDRRALFVKSDTKLSVYAHWGERVAEDLRHEVTHGYLHSVIPNLPLWLDEGLAEFFEVPRGKQGLNESHVVLLKDRLRRNEWHPDLVRLESLVVPSELTQLDYAEAWLWVHFMLHYNDHSRQMLKDKVEVLRLTGKTGPFAIAISNLLPEMNEKLLAHLDWVDSTRSQSKSARVNR